MVLESSSPNSPLGNKLNANENLSFLDRLGIF